MKQLDVMEVKIKYGVIRVTKSTDPNYPGVDVEFISNDENPLALSRPRVLVEFAGLKDVTNPELRALVWNNPSDEDYNEEIKLASFPNKRD